MKLLLFSIFIVINLASSQKAKEVFDKNIAELLLSRGHSLIDKAVSIIDKYKVKHEHLLTNIENIKNKIEELIDEFKIEYIKTDLTKNELHAMSENLLHLENRLTEEFIIFKRIIDNEYDDDDDKLIERAKRLVKIARDYLRRYNINPLLRATMHLQITAINEIIFAIHYGLKQNRPINIIRLRSQVKSLENILKRIKK